jgi:hypothetical protein
MYEFFSTKKKEEKEEESLSLEFTNFSSLIDMRMRYTALASAIPTY